MRAIVVFGVLATIAACTVTRHYGVDGEPGPDANGPDSPPDLYPAPDDDLVPAIGSDGTLEIATWNIRNFPADPSTPSLVADLIASLDLDVIVVEEIASETAWGELIERLPHHHGVLSTHHYTPTEYQKIGVIYREGLATTVGQPALLFEHDEFRFPRPALSVGLTIDQRAIEIIGLHLKAGIGSDDQERRRQAVIALDEHLRRQIADAGEPEIVVLGDYNQVVTTDAGRSVLAPLLSAPDRYTVRTVPAAIAGESSYLGFGGSFIDHIATTAALDATWGSARIEVAELDDVITGYRDRVSDHLPVVLIVDR